MSETKRDWTPGPWTACHNGDCPCKTVSSAHHPIAEITSGDWGDDYPAIRLVGDSTIDQKAEAYMEQITYGRIDPNTARANARLIAAAPDLYEALERIVEEFRRGGGKQSSFDSAAAALAKARGAA